MSVESLVRFQAHPICVTGSLIELPLTHLKIGEVCDIRRAWNDREVVARAVVLGFKHNKTLLSLMGSLQGLNREMVVCPTGQEFVISLSEDLRGCVMTSMGDISERLYVHSSYGSRETRTVNAPPPNYQQRRGIDSQITTGVRAIDGLLTCGRGQRMGIFASAGCGKTTLMQMIINNAQADLFVVALIGERGREVTEFVEDLRISGQAHRCIVVYATSDFSAMERMNAASVAMSVAEYFRDKGQDVILFLDSVTRYARAVRDVALMAGEPPARRGYPASVFERLPALLERPGVTASGSITGFFTILLESEDETDPIAEEIRSILDGHIVLSRKIAAKNLFPAIDVLRSISRVCNRICSPEHLVAAGKVRTIMSEIEELQVLIDFGEYRHGIDSNKDKLYSMIPNVKSFLSQGIKEKVSAEDIIRSLYALIE